MLERIDRRNREVWQGHSAVYRDFTEMLAGFGVGFLVFGLIRPAARPFGFLLAGLALGLYAFAALSRRRRRAFEPDEFTLKAGDVTMF